MAALGRGAVQAGARHRTPSTTLTKTVAIDNPPNGDGDHHGSAYQGSWYGYVSKDLRTRARRARARAVLARVLRQGRCKRCRAALRRSLAAALKVPAERGLQRRRGVRGRGKAGDQWCFDAVRQRPTGGATQPLIHWINRPTFQQANEIHEAPAALETRMAWVDTASETFVARHDERDAEDAERVLAQLEFARTRLEERFDTRPGELEVVLHSSSAQLDAAQPWVPLARRLTAPAARRYVVGWAGPRELHVLARGCSRTGPRTSRARWRC